MPEESEAKPVVDATLSDLYTDEELLAYANDHFEDYWKTYYGFMTGTYFEGTGEFGNVTITDPNIHYKMLKMFGIRSFPEGIQSLTWI